MSKSIFLFKLNDNFKSLLKENNIDIILEIFCRAISSNFYKEQFHLMIDEINEEIIKNNIYNFFKNNDNFFIEKNSFIIHNIYKDNNEIIYFNKNYVNIIYEENSLFLDYLNTFFIDLIAINLKEKKIYSLHLVKNNILV